MINHLLLHIGLPKTGSSFIQTVLDLNRYKLAQCGITVPAFPLGAEPYKGIPTKGHWGFDPKAQLPESYDKVILSSEQWSIHIDKLDLAAYASLCKHCTVVLYTRPFREWLPSAWKQTVKTNGNTERFFPWLSRCLADPKDTLLEVYTHINRWIDTATQLGWQLRIVPYTVDSNQLLADLFAPLESPLLIDKLNLPKGLINRSTTYQETEQIRLLNLKDPKLGAKLNESLMKQTEFENQPICVPPAQIKLLKQLLGNQVKSLNQKVSNQLFKI
jgi:hypothetical protein